MTEILSWKPLVPPAGNTVGFAEAEFKSGMQISGIVIMNSREGLVALPPGRPKVGKDGVALRKANGKVDYDAVIRFRTKEIRDAWSSQVISALLAAYPEVGE